MYCTYCGSKLDENARYCSSCGAPVDGTEPQTQGETVVMDTTTPFPTAKEIAEQQTAMGLRSAPPVVGEAVAEESEDDGDAEETDPEDYAGESYIEEDSTADEAEYSADEVSEYAEDFSEENFEEE